MAAGVEGYINPRSARGNTGCWSCRFRKKKCQKSDATNPVCDDCRRFHMECIGSGDERPRRPGLSQKAREVLGDWIKSHSKETPDPNEPPLSISYLWTNPDNGDGRGSSLGRSPSSQRSSQNHHIRRSSDSGTYTRTVSASHTHSRNMSSSSFGSEQGPTSSHLNAFSNTLPSSSYLGVPGTSTQTGSSSHHRRNSYGGRSSVPPPEMLPSAFTNRQGYSPYHQQTQSVPPLGSQQFNYSRSTGAIPNTHNTSPSRVTQVIQNNPSTSSHINNLPSLLVPTTSSHQSQHHHSNSLPNPPSFDFVVTPDDQSMPINMGYTDVAITSTAQIPWLIDANLPYQTNSLSVSSSPSFLSPGSPYASSILSSTSSLDDGNWGPPSPSYYSNEIFLEDGVVGEGQGLGVNIGTGTAGAAADSNTIGLGMGVSGSGTSTVSIGQPTSPNPAHGHGLPNQMFYQ